MSLSSAVASVTSFFSGPLVERAVKTFIEATAAQAAVYTTVVPNTPGIKTSASISVGATLISLVWNGLTKWALNTKNAKLDALAQAIDRAVDARLAAQAEVPKLADPGNVIVAP